MSSRTRIHDGSSGAAHPAATTALLLAGYYVIGLAANFCFKEGGTDAAHRLAYFIGGNAFGITSTALLMGMYARMNVNLAMVLGTSGAFLLQQVGFWAVYHTPLTLMQAAGILMVGVGTVMASLQPAKQRPDPKTIPADGNLTEASGAAGPTTIFTTKDTKSTKTLRGWFLGVASAQASEEAKQNIAHPGAHTSHLRVLRVLRGEFCRSPFRQRRLRSPEGTP